MFLFQEPFAFTPAQVAALTDDQIRGLYFDPAVRRGEEMERRAKGVPSPVGPVEECRPEDIPDRETLERYAVMMFGSVKRAEG